MINRSVVVGLALAVLSIPSWAQDEVRPAEKNYHIVFHTTLSGQSEDIALTISEGNFEIRMNAPDIRIGGYLEVTEDFMHRLEYRFSHAMAGGGGNDEGESARFERSGSVVLEPGETVTVVNAPSVELGIELTEVR